MSDTTQASSRLLLSAEADPFNHSHTWYGHIGHFESAEHAREATAVAAALPSSHHPEQRGLVRVSPPLVRPPPPTTPRLTQQVEGGERKRWWEGGSGLQWTASESCSRCGVALTWLRWMIGGGRVGIPGNSGTKTSKCKSRRAISRQPCRRFSSDFASVSGWQKVQVGMEWAALRSTSPLTSAPPPLPPPFTRLRRRF